jgi:4-amino-4-deoxy-L-arabinose transferase-like glycosyltransferase
MREVTAALRVTVPDSRPDERAPTPVRDRWPAAALVSTAARWGIIAFSALACVMMLWWPLGYDHGIFASNGDILLRGGAPYRDAFELRGPLAFYTSAAIQLLFGRHSWGLRLVDVAMALLTAWLLRDRLRTLTSPRTALTAAALWPLVVASLTYDGSAQFDLWVGTAMLAATLAVARPGGYRARDLVLSGALIALASLTKPCYPAFLAVPGLVVLAHRRRVPGSVPRDLALLVAGWLAPIALAAVALLSQGVLRDAWNANIVYNLTVYAPASEFSAFPSSSPLVVMLNGTWKFLSQPVVMLLIAPVVGGVVVLWKRARVLAVGLLAWLTTGTFFVLLQNKFWPYHWSPIYPALLLLAAVGIHAAVADSRRSDTRATAALAITCAAVLVTVLSVRPAIDLRRWARFVTGQKDAAWYYGTFLQYGSTDPAEERAVAAYLQAHTPAGATFAHWSLDGGLAFLAGRPNVTRFHNKRVLMGPLMSPTTRTMRTEYLDRVRTLRPTYLVVSERTGGPDTTRSAALLASEFPELAELVAGSYAVEARIGMVDLYRLREPAAAPTRAGASR